MAYVPTTPLLGIQAIADTSTTANHPLGTIVTAYDPTYGAGEFIYLEGVANTVVGLVVSYNTTSFQTALSANTANLTTPIAVAMSANVADQYGWYQIAGVAVVKKTAVAVAPAVALYQSGTTGRLMSTVATNKQVQNAVSANTATVASATSTVNVLINRPAMQGAI